VPLCDMVEAMSAKRARRQKRKNGTRQV